MTTFKADHVPQHHNNPLITPLRLRAFTSVVNLRLCVSAEDGQMFDAY